MKKTYENTPSLFLMKCGRLLQEINQNEPLVEERLGLVFESEQTALVFVKTLLAFAEQLGPMDYEAGKRWHDCIEDVAMLWDKRQDKF